MVETGQCVTQMFKVTAIGGEILTTFKGMYGIKVAISVVDFAMGTLCRR